MLDNDQLRVLARQMGLPEDDPRVLEALRTLRREGGSDSDIAEPAAQKPPPVGTEPGWYPNPSAPGQRYWDGSTWTGRYADDKGNVLDVPPPARDDFAGRPPAALWVALAGGVAIVVGSLAPWSDTLGDMKSGIGWGDGVITVILGALALLLIWAAWANKSRKAAIACGVVAMLVFLVGILDWATIRDTSELAKELSDAQGDDIFGAMEILANESSLRSVAWGLYVMQFGAVALAIASFPLERALLKRHKVAGPG